MTEGIARKGFDIDLREANIREERLAKILTGTTIEVKTDYKALQTGNMFLEYEFNGLPSGIATTEAEYWAIELIESKQWVLIETERLKQLGRKALANLRVTKGGDYNNSKGVLIPLKWLLK